MIIHQSIKKALGYEEKDTDDTIISDWKKKISKVCKPCWEIKYCPYGPFVEKSPVLPSLRSTMIKNQEYLKKCLETGIMGFKQKIDISTKELYRDIISDAKQDPSRLAIILKGFISFEKEFQKAHDQGKDPLSILRNNFDRIETGRPPFPLCFEEDIPEVVITEEIAEAIKIELNNHHLKMVG